MNELERADKAYEQSLDVPPSPYVWMMDSEFCYDCGDVLNLIEESGQCWRCAEAEREIDEEDVWYDEYGDSDYREYEVPR